MGSCSEADTGCEHPSAEFSEDGELALPCGIVLYSNPSMLLSKLIWLPTVVSWSVEYTV